MTDQASDIEEKIFQAAGRSDNEALRTVASSLKELRDSGSWGPASVEEALDQLAQRGESEASRT